MVAMEMNVLVGFNASSSSSRRREGINLDTLSDFIKKKVPFKSSYLAIQGSAKRKQRAETFEWQRKKTRKGNRTIERKGLRMKKRWRLRENLK